MKDAKGNKVQVGTRLYANLGRYGPCATIVDFKKNAFEDSVDCAYVQYDSSYNSFPISVESLRTSYWSAQGWSETRHFFQEIIEPFSDWWKELRKEVRNLVKLTKELYRKKPNECQQPQSTQNYQEILDMFSSTAVKKYRCMQETLQKQERRL